MIKGIRRSIKGEKPDISIFQGPKVSHISITPKSAITIQPPKKVIRAKADYTPNGSDELGFQKGDFFHVIGNEDDTEWWEACNPATNARGLVPVPYFQVLGKNERDSADSVASGHSDSIRYSEIPNRKGADADSGYADRMMDRQNEPQPQRLGSSGTDSRRPAGKAGSPLYGIVLYDFVAERPDELEAKIGEAIIVIAQSNKEWFVAKPIGRLGGPGLIPVDYIEIRDMATGQAVEDVQAAIARAGVPKVEEWKKMAAEYKNSSISLGKFESDDVAQKVQAVSLQDNANRHTLQASYNSGARDPYRHSRSSSLGLLSAPVSASVDRYAFENGRYWYVLNAVMEDGRHWSLCRYYEDFYDFQIALLDEFKEEAGHTGQARTLPYMPGPVTYVTDTISAARRQSLDEYIKKLISMSPYISKSRLVKQLFAPRPNDVETTQYRQSQISLQDNRKSTGSQQSSDSSREPSRQSSHVNLNGNSGNNGYPGLSAPPPRTSGHGPRHGSQGSNVISQAQQVQIRNGSDLQPPRMLRNDSAMSAATQGAGNSQVGTSGFIKFKISYQEDLVAIRLPRDVTFAQLQEKLQERLGTELNVIQYKDEPTGHSVNLESDGDLQVALSRNPKILLFVK
ncbi:bud emergence protein 1 [Rhizina undulata]